LLFASVLYTNSVSVTVRRCEQKKQPTAVMYFL